MYWSDLSSETNWRDEESVSKSHAEPDLKSWVWEKIKSLSSLSFFSAWPESFLVLGNSHDPVNMLNDVCKEVYVCPSGAWEVLSIICFARHTVLNPKYPENKLYRSSENMLLTCRYPSFNHIWFTNALLLISRVYFQCLHLEAGLIWVQQHVPIWDLYVAFFTLCF